MPVAAAAFFCDASSVDSLSEAHFSLTFSTFFDKDPDFLRFLLIPPIHEVRSVCLIPPFGGNGRMRAKVSWVCAAQGWEAGRQGRA